MADVNIVPTGSNFVLVHPLTPAAREWVEENVAEPGWFGDAFPCEHRYIEDLVDGMRGDGLTVE